MTRRTYENLKNHYDNLFEKMVIKSSWDAQLSRRAREIAVHKHIYKSISEELGGKIPWQFIGIIHSLESSLNFKAHLHNGDSLQRRTYRVPKNRPNYGSGPYTFKESAVDALKMKGLHLIDEWPMSRVLYELERYNGFGYMNKGINTPYLWSGTNLYTKGRYVRDHVFDRNATTKQSGAVPLLTKLMNDDKEDSKPPVEVSGRELSGQSKKVNVARRANDFITFTGIGGLLSWSTLTSVRTFVTDNIGLILFILGVTAYLVFKYIEYRSVKDFNEGRYIPSGAKEKTDVVTPEIPEEQLELDNQQDEEEARGLNG